MSAFVQHFNKLNRIMNNAHKYETYTVKEKLEKEAKQIEINYSKGKLTDQNLEMLYSCFPIKRKVA